MDFYNSMSTSVACSLDEMSFVLSGHEHMYTAVHVSLLAVSVGTKECHNKICSLNLNLIDAVYEFEEESNFPYI